MLSPVSFTGGNDTGDKLFTGVNDTADKVFHRRCIDDRGLFFLQNYLRPPKSNMIADIVFGTAMKRRKSTSHTLIRGPGGRQNYFKPKRHYLDLAASGASDQDVWGVFIAVPMTPSSAMPDFGGWRYRRFVPFPSTFSYPWQLPTNICSLILSQAINLSLVSLSSAINSSPVSTTPAIT
jgi:hypothetical protein